MAQQLAICRSMVLVAGILASACGGGGPKAPANQPDHPLLRGLKPPPVNLPAKSSAPPAPTGRGNEQRAPAAGGITTTRAGKPFQGALNVTGRISLKDGSCTVVGPDDVPLELTYVLPPGLPAPPAREVRGDVSVVDRLTPNGPNRQMLVQVDGAVVLAYVAMTSDRPIEIRISDTLRLVQLPLVFEQMPSYKAVSLEARPVGQPAIPVPLKTVVGFPTRAGTLAGWAELSEALVSKYTRDQIEGLYRLEAWVVSTGP